MLALGVLRGLARALEAVLLALLHAWVARQEAALAHRDAQFLVGTDKRARNAVPHSAGLAAHATAHYLDGNVEAVDQIDGTQRAAHRLHQRLAREILIRRTPVHNNIAVAIREEPDARHSSLAPARTVVIRPKILRQDVSPPVVRFEEV